MSLAQWRDRYAQAGCGPGDCALDVRTALGRFRFTLKLNVVVIGRYKGAPH